MRFLISWSIPNKNRVQCLNIFGNMTPDDDVKDSGPDIKVIGRWHLLAGSGGVCVIETENANALNSWVLNWTPLCEISVEPVVEDASARLSIQSKQYFVPKDSSET